MGFAASAPRGALGSSDGTIRIDDCGIACCCGVAAASPSPRATSGRNSFPPNAFMYSVQFPSSAAPSSPRVAPSDIISFASMFSIMCTAIASGVAGVRGEPNS